MIIMCHMLTGQWYEVVTEEEVKLHDRNRPLNWEVSWVRECQDLVFQWLSSSSVWEYHTRCHAEELLWCTEPTHLCPRLMQPIVCRCHGCLQKEETGFNSLKQTHQYYTSSRKSLFSLNIQIWNMAVHSVRIWLCRLCKNQSNYQHHDYNGTWSLDNDSTQIKASKRSTENDMSMHVLTMVTSR